MHEILNDAVAEPFIARVVGRGVFADLIIAGGAVGLIYKMGRLFELSRPWRAFLAITVALGSGLISYSVALNTGAPAAALTLSAVACLVHLSLAKAPHRMGGWLVLSGFCAALAAVIDLAAGIFLVGLVFVIPAMPWRKSLRVGGFLLYVLGALPPIALHASLTVPVTGSLLPGFLMPQSRADVMAAAAASSAIDPTDDEAPSEHAWLHAAFESAEKVVAALVGSHGVYSHFPVLLLGMAGLFLVLRRHWPATIKVLAVVTLFGGIAIVVAYAIFRADWTQAMFGPRWFIVFMPLMLFWAGAWMRKPHRPLAWATAGLLLAFSAAVSLIGVTNPFVHASDRYTAMAAFDQLMKGKSASITSTPLETPALFAGR